MYKNISRCRICGNSNLVKILDLGIQYLTGIFPESVDDEVTSGPLQLLKCHGDDACNLLQLAHSYELSEMYGKNYGYRSGLNSSMVNHLKSKVNKIQELITINASDLVIDIGSNDGTTLSFYEPGPLLVGVDPTGVKFSEYYRNDIILIPDFFSAQLIKDRYPHRRAKVITSFAMFYDLESPIDFMRQIFDVLDDDGVWMFEQSYMPLMLKTSSFDTVCHEHLEYYGLKQILWMTDQIGFEIADVELNDVNGGSFSVTVKKSKRSGPISSQVALILEQESSLKLNALDPYRYFETAMMRACSNLIDFVKSANSQGKRVGALGASTKGNVLLQYCRFTKDDIFAIGEVNTDKFGCLTPGSWIPIIDQREILEAQPDYLVVLPWHFRDFFISNISFSGQTLVFPLPELEVIRV